MSTPGSLRAHHFSNQKTVKALHLQNSSTITDETSRPTHAGGPDWDTPGSVPDKPSVCDYGYVAKGQAVGCSREELIASFIARGPDDLKLVWTPETPEPVFPEKVPELVGAFKRISVKAANKNIYWGVGFVAVSATAAVWFDDSRVLFRSLFAILGALALVDGAWQRIRLRHYTQEDAAAEASSLRFNAWIKNKQITGYTLALGAYIVLVGASQVVAGEDSINHAGLVKQAVWDGQVWRLLTACLMHVSFIHFWLNALALAHFAKIVEQTSRRAYVPLIFLVSGVCGSVFSVLLYPHSTSVGASGGLMGLLGFITVTAYFDKKTYPPKYLRNSIEAIVIIGVFGLLGYMFIDNAAHLGGLCGGLLLGWLLPRPYNQKSDEGNPPERSGRLVAAIGVAALIILGLGAAMAIVKILG